MVSLCKHHAGYKGYQDYRVWSRDTCNLEKSSPREVPPSPGIKPTASSMKELEPRESLACWAAWEGTLQAGFQGREGNMKTMTIYCISDQRAELEINMSDFAEALCWGRVTDVW